MKNMKKLTLLLCTAVICILMCSSAFALTRTVRLKPGQKLKIAKAGSYRTEDKTIADVALSGKIRGVAPGETIVRSWSTKWLRTYRVIVTSPVKYSIALNEDGSYGDMPPVYIKTKGKYKVRYGIDTKKCRRKDTYGMTPGNHKVWFTISKGKKQKVKTYVNVTIRKHKKCRPAPKPAPAPDIRPINIMANDIALTANGTSAFFSVSADAGYSYGLQLKRMTPVNLPAGKAGISASGPIVSGGRLTGWNLTADTPCVCQAVITLYDANGNPAAQKAVLARAN